MFGNVSAWSIHKIFEYIVKKWPNLAPVQEISDIWRKWWQKKKKKNPGANPDTAGKVNLNPCVNIESLLTSYASLKLQFLCPATKSGGVLCYTLRHFECLSIRLSVHLCISLSVRLSVCQWFIIHVRSITLIPFEIISRNMAQI